MTRPYGSHRARDMGSTPPGEPAADAPEVRFTIYLS